MMTELEYLYPKAIRVDDDLKSRYGNSYSGVANYCADLLNHEIPIQVIQENLLASIVEHPIADSIGVYSYQGEWGQKGLEFMGSSLEPSLIEGIVNTHGQIPEFEIPRNKANYNFYFHRLKPARKAGSKETFIELSPSPTDLNSNEVISRGYKGNDAIFIYSYGENGEESITQYWFPATDHSHYFRLLDALEIESKNVNSSVEGTTDAEIMQHSGQVTDLQLEGVMQFVNERRSRFFSPELQEQLMGIKDDYFRNKINNELFPFMVGLMGRYKSGLIKETEFERALATIESRMNELQFELRLMMKNIMNIDTFNSFTAKKIAQYGITYEHYYFLDEASKQNLVKNVNYQMSGCGFGTGNSTFNRVNNSVFGRSGGILSMKDKELYEFICPNCGHKHDIDVPNHKYVEKCELCGFNAKCSRV